MLAFIDESGDAGFRLEQGSSTHFVAAMVIFADPASASHASRLINALAGQTPRLREFKFASASPSLRDQFFEVVGECSFSVRAIVVNKRRIRSHHLRLRPAEFYRYMVQLLLQHDGGRLAQARIVIDGSGERAWRRELSSAFKKRTEQGAIRSIKFAPSHTDPLLQLADMCVGAIARSYTDRTDASRWRHRLRSKLDDVWEFR